MGIKLSDYRAVTLPFLDEADAQLKRVVYATRTAEVRAIDDESWTLLLEGQFDQLPKDMLFDLIDIELLVPSTENELMTILDHNDVAAIEDDTVFFSVQPTAFCQLGCHYCGQEHRHKLLTPEHQQQLIQRARTRLAEKPVRRFAITWFGAEPLIGLPVIRSLTPQFQALAAEYECSYQSKIVTNGLALTETIAAELIENFNLKTFEITLDGIAEFHNARRMQKNGMPTFDQIFKNVVSLAQHPDPDMQIVIRCNVDRQNYEAVSPLLQMLAEAGIQERITFYVAPVHSWGNDAHTRSLTAEEFATWEINWFCEMLQLGFSLAVIPNRKSTVCMAVKPRSELVDAYGTVFNCTEVSYVPAYGTPNEFAIDHLSGLPMPGTRDRLGQFNDRVREGAYPCSTCRMLPVCGGACPKAWQEGLEPCPSAKRNIEERLLLSFAVSRLSNEVEEVIAVR